MLALQTEAFEQRIDGFLLDERVSNLRSRVAVQRSPGTDNRNIAKEILENINAVVAAFLVINPVVIFQHRWCFV